MPTARSTCFAVVLALVLVALAGCSIPAGTEPSGHSFNGTVIEIVDGDTIDVRLENGTVERVRLLGIDTPEVHVEVQPGEYEDVPDTEAGRACLQEAGENASAAVEARFADERVTLRLDPQADARGGYDRMLAIVVHDNSSLNYELIEDGHARLYDTDFSQRDRYAAAEQAAMDADRGLWTCRSAG